jgi:hypothetical protein
VVPALPPVAEPPEPPVDPPEPPVPVLSSPPQAPATKTGTKTEPARTKEILASFFIVTLLIFPRAFKRFEARHPFYHPIEGA